MILVLVVKMGRGDKKLAVFNLPEDIRDREVEDLFSKFGRITRCVARPQGRASMAFVEFQDDRDAAEALDRRHGYEIEGSRLRVEFSKPRRDDSRRRSRDRPVLRDAWYRLRISDMPDSASWQDLKDFLRDCRGAQVKFTEIEGKGVGVAGFATKEEVTRCIDELDDTKFRSRNGDTKYVRLKADGGGEERSRSRSRR